MEWYDLRGGSAFLGAPPRPEGPQKGLLMGHDGLPGSRELDHLKDRPVLPQGPHHRLSGSKAFPGARPPGPLLPQTPRSPQKAHPRGGHFREGEVDRRLPARETP